MNDQNFNDQKPNDQNFYSPTTDNQNLFNPNPNPQNFYQPNNAPKSTGKGFSIAALVLGIVSCVLAWIYIVNVIALIASIVGVVLAAVGRKNAREAGAPTGMDTAGLVLSIVGLSLSALGFISCTLCYSYIGTP